MFLKPAPTTLDTAPDMPSAGPHPSTWGWRSQGRRRATRCAASRAPLPARRGPVGTAGVPHSPAGGRAQAPDVWLLPPSSVVRPVHPRALRALPRPLPVPSRAAAQVPHRSRGSGSVLLERRHTNAGTPVPPNRPPAPAPCAGAEAQVAEPQRLGTLPQIPLHPLPGAHLGSRMRGL